MDYFNYNGKILKEGTPFIGPDNRGLRYGDGLFETIKMIKGDLIFEDEHFARLWKGLMTLQFILPRHFTAENLQQEIKSLARKNGHETAARIRLQIIRGDGGLYDAKNYAPNYIIQTWPLADSHCEWNINGLVLGIYSGAKKSCDILSNLKNNNYLPYVMAALAAKKEKWNDAILLNTNERICETTIANIFMVKDNVIHTPSLNEGCVEGIMRRMVIKFLTQNGWELVEQEIKIDDLLYAGEVFLTNSIYNLQWVQRIGEVTYTQGISQKIFAAFLQTI